MDLQAGGVPILEAPGIVPFSPENTSQPPHTLQPQRVTQSPSRNAVVVVQRSVDGQVGFRTPSDEAEELAWMRA